MAEKELGVTKRRDPEGEGDPWERHLGTWELPPTRKGLWPGIAGWTGGGRRGGVDGWITRMNDSLRANRRWEARLGTVA